MIQGTLDENHEDDFESSCQEWRGTGDFMSALFQSSQILLGISFCLPSNHPNLFPDHKRIHGKLLFRLFLSISFFLSVLWILLSSSSSSSSSTQDLLHINDHPSDDIMTFNSSIEYTTLDSDGVFQQNSHPSSSSQEIETSSTSSYDYLPQLPTPISLEKKDHDAIKKSKLTTSTSSFPSPSTESTLDSTSNRRRRKRSIQEVMKRRGWNKRKRVSPKENIRKREDDDVGDQERSEDEREEEGEEVEYPIDEDTLQEEIIILANVRTGDETVDDDASTRTELTFSSGTSTSGNLKEEEFFLMSSSFSSTPHPPSSFPATTSESLFMPHAQEQQEQQHQRQEEKSFSEKEEDDVEDDDHEEFYTIENQKRKIKSDKAISLMSSPSTTFSSDFHPFHSVNPSLSIRVDDDKKRSRKEENKGFMNSHSFNSFRTKRTKNKRKETKRISSTGHQDSTIGHSYSGKKKKIMMDMSQLNQDEDSMRSSQLYIQEEDPQDSPFLLFKQHVVTKRGEEEMSLHPNEESTIDVIESKRRKGDHPETKRNKTHDMNGCPNVKLFSWDLLMWNLSFFIINMIQTMILGYQALPVKKMSKKLESVYTTLFQPLMVDEKEFKQLIKHAIISKLEKDDKYSIENQTKIDQKVSILLSGKLKVSCDDVLLHIIEPNHFIDSPEFNYISIFHSSSDSIHGDENQENKEDDLIESREESSRADEIELKPLKEEDNENDEDNMSHVDKDNDDVIKGESTDEDLIETKEPKDDNQKIISKHKRKKHHRQKLRKDSIMDHDEETQREEDQLLSQVTISALEDSVILTWDRKLLVKETFSQSKRLQKVFSNLIGKDITNKLHLINETHKETREKAEEIINAAAATASAIVNMTRSVPGSRRESGSSYRSTSRRGSSTYDLFWWKNNNNNGSTGGPGGSQNIFEQQQHPNQQLLHTYELAGGQRSHSIDVMGMGQGMSLLTTGSHQNRSRRGSAASINITDSHRNYRRHSGYSIGSSSLHMGHPQQLANRRLSASIPQTSMIPATAYFIPANIARRSSFQSSGSSKSGDPLLKGSNKIHQSTSTQQNSPKKYISAASAASASGLIAGTSLAQPVFLVTSSDPTNLPQIKVISASTHSAKFLCHNSRSSSITPPPDLKLDDININITQDNMIINNINAVDQKDEDDEKRHDEQIEHQNDDEDIEDYVEDHTHGRNRRESYAMIAMMDDQLVYVDEDTIDSRENGGDEEDEEGDHRPCLGQERTLRSNLML